MDLFKCKHILCVRLDNMGDVLMSSPAIHAVKSTFHCKITLLTSSMGNPIVPFIPVIDDVLVFDVPWVKVAHTESEDVKQLITELESRKFDAAIIFTVFSQSSLPAALLLYLAKIPIRIAYCRENPYNLLTHWVPDEEPYTKIKHQVRRDLDLVKSIGASIKDERLTLRIPPVSNLQLQEKFKKSGVDMEKPWMILHPGVSEEKRQYPKHHWIDVGKKIVSQLKYQVVITGGPNEKELCTEISNGIGKNVCCLAGLLSMDEFIVLIQQAPIVVSVNTATVHIAAATHTPVVVLYALTNPQHSPWKAPGKVLLFDVAKQLQSKNEVLKFLQLSYLNNLQGLVEPDEIIKSITELLAHLESTTYIPEMITVK